MAIRERVSLYKRYLDDRLLSKDVFKTYYIIMEGTNTEPIYFKLLERKLSELKIHNSIKLVFLDRTLRDRGSNAPRQLLHYVLAYKQEVDDENSKFFIVFDRDSFKTNFNQELDYLSFIEDAKAKDVNLIITSPCFEIWILLHKENSYEEFIKPNKSQIFENKRLSPSYTYVSKLVTNIFGFNPKSNIPYSLLEKLDVAIQESKNITKQISKMAYEIGENVSVFIMNLLKDPRN